MVAGAVTIVLVALGSGLGLASLSPWADRGVTATTFEVGTAIGFIVVQWLASAIGGYLAGRLRTRWIGAHTHEVFFRDTAHGFITWALATLIVASVLASSLTSLISAGSHAARAVAATGIQAAAAGGYMSTSVPTSYGLDRLFRTEPSGNSGQNASDSRAESGRILAQAIATHGAVPQTDRAYLTSLVAARTGVSADAANKRVDDFIAAANEAEAKVKAAADAATKAAAESSIYAALSMLVGAFIACVSAALGGRIRDEHP